MSQRSNINPRRHARSLLVCGMCAVVFMITAFTAHKGVMGSGELRIFNVINGLPDWLRWGMVVLTQFGSIGIASTTFVYALIGRKFELARLLFLSAGGTYVLVEGFKLLIDRPRPFLEVAAAQRDVLVYGLGFPSGHTATAAAVSVSLALYFGGKWRVLPFVWIPLIAFTRVYLGVHAPLDTIGGAALGTGAAVGIFSLRKVLSKNL